MEVPLLVDDFLRRPVRLYPDKTAIVDGERRFTYRDFGERVNRLSNALLEMGVGKGDRVCILSPNSHFFLESFYGTSRIGAVLVPLNYRLAAADYEYIIDHAGVKVMLADPEYTGLVDGIRARLPTVEHWIVAADSGARTTASEERVGEGTEPGDDPDRFEGPDCSRAPDGWVDWEGLIADADPGPPPPIERHENELVSINYTSGTTARPKGVMLTHRNCYINAYGLIAHLRIDHDDVELWTLPMFHCNGWGGVYALTGMGGTHVVLRTVDAAEIYRLIEREGVTFACMAPTVLRLILDYPDKDRHEIRTRPRFALAGAPPPESYVRRLEEELGWRFLEIYGLTETAPLLTVSKPDHATAADDFERRARAGVPALGVDLQVLDDAGRPVPKDDTTIGEVCARSNVVFAGYWRQDDATAGAIRDGWFHSGDLAVWDETGNVHIVDRKKDIIISGGENISSPEVEEVLYAHPAVLECAVIGVPDDRWGETPKAIVVLREGHDETGVRQLIDHCRERLAHFKCPTSVEFVDALPRTATGKLQKYRLREEYWKDRDRRVG